jgi:hypothetical protein
LPGDTLEDIRIYFITVATNAYTAMHFDVHYIATGPPHELLKSSFQNTCSDTPPTGV